MKKDIIYPTEKSVKDDMVKNGLKEVTMFKTAYVDNSDNYQKFGYTVEDIDKGYYAKQGVLSESKRTFKVD